MSYVRQYLLSGAIRNGIYLFLFYAYLLDGLDGLISQLIVLHSISYLPLLYIIYMMI